MGRAPCCDKANVKKGPWSAEEDAKLKSYLQQHGTAGNWIALPQKIGLKRCGKSCRLRWLNYLRPNIKHGGFSDEEDSIICSLYITIGSRWSIIAAQLPGRTDNDIKNYWNTRLKKKLLGKHRKENHTRGRETSTSLKQNSVEFSGSLMNQLTEPQLPALPPVPYSNEEPRLNDHDAIRKLLVKLGGRFWDGDRIIEVEQTELEYAAIDEALTQPVYNHPIDFISSYDQIPFLNTTSSASSMAILAEPSISLAEFPQKLQGLEFFYDDFMNCGTIYGESMEMNSFGSAASASTDNQGLLQGSALMEEFGVNKII